jgi:outer membrane protein assembly factor BamB
MRFHREVIRHALLVLAALALVGSVCKKPPQVPDKPTGPNRAVVGTVATFSTKTTDASGSTVRYQFDWNDGTTSSWGPFIEQDVAYPDTHTFAQKGSFAIRAHAQNTTNATSGWSDTLRVAALSGETTLKWVYAYLDENFDSVLFTGTVAESPDGYVYAVSEGGFLHVITPTGTRRAFFGTIDQEEFTTGPMIGNNGLAYVVADTTIYAIRVNGTRAYTIAFRNSVIGALACDANGRVYANCENDSLYCADSTGLRWAARTGSGPSSPAVSADGAMVVVGGGDGMIQAFSTDNGAMLWQWTTGDAVNSTAAFGSDGMIYIGSDDGALYAMKPDGGAPSWQYAANSPISTAPVIDANGIIYFAADDGVVHAVNSATHAAVWTQPLNADQVSTGALTQGGELLFKALYSSEDSLIALSAADGTHRWSASLPSGTELDITCSPLVDQSGTIYVTTGTGVYAFYGQSGPAASSWPMFQHDMERTGKAQ